MSLNSPNSSIEIDCNLPNVDIYGTLITEISSGTYQVINPDQSTFTFTAGQNNNDVSSVDAASTNHTVAEAALPAVDPTATLQVHCWIHPDGLECGFGSWIVVDGAWKQTGYHRHNPLNVETFYNGFTANTLGTNVATGVGDVIGEDLAALTVVTECATDILLNGYWHMQNISSFQVDLDLASQMQFRVNGGGWLFLGGNINYRKAESAEEKAGNATGRWPAPSAGTYVFDFRRITAVNNEISGALMMENQVRITAAWS